MLIKKIGSYFIFMSYSLVIFGCEASPYVDIQGKFYKYQIPDKFVRKIRGSLYGLPVGGDDDSKSISLEVPWDSSGIGSNDRLSIMIFFDRDYSAGGGMIASIKRGRSLWPYKKIKEESGYFVYEHGSTYTKYYYTFDIDNMRETTQDDFSVSVLDSSNNTLPNFPYDISDKFRASLQELNQVVSCDLTYIRDGLEIEVSPLHASIPSSDPRRCQVDSFRDIKQTMDDYVDSWKTNKLGKA